ncbi:WD40 repeat-like protein [Suillus brevipes Sb2]|nr:WD40 repeat-like protein [Suillus brevipes Sb2]
MLSEVSESSTSAGRRDGQPETPSKPPAPVVLLRTSEKEPPPYGAQHRQDALWEGGNEALPPLWQQFKVSDEIQYQDDTLIMVSRNRALPGVRLDEPGQLVVPECEWHISPLGRSYFVNHNTRTTSWKKPKPERPAGSLAPECIIEGHSLCIWSLAYLKASCNVMSASQDGSIRQWKRDGELVGKPLDNGEGIAMMAVSPDETKVVSGSDDGRLRLWNIKEPEGNMIGDPWEGHDDAVRCLDWSPNAPEIASGSEDGTIRRWNPDTGRQIAPPIKTRHGWVNAVKYSPQGDKFISGGYGAICVWSRDGKLLIEMKGHDDAVTSLCWSRDGGQIFSGSLDDTIRKWRAIDGKELVVFRGHTNIVRSLCLTPNERYIVSASDDFSVRIWDLTTNQAVGDPLLHDDMVPVVTMSPDGTFIASAGLDKKIYVWSLEAALERHQGADDSNAKFKATQPRIPNTGGSAKYGKDFFADHSNRPTASPANPSFLNWRSLFSSTGAPRPSPREYRHRNFLNSLHFTTPPNAPQSLSLQPRRRNFNLFPGGSSIPIVEVAAGRKKNRIYVSPPSAAELARAEAAAAAQHANGNQASSSAQVGQPQASPQTQVSQGPTETQGAGGGTGDVSYEGVNCCGFFFGRRRPASHQS